MPVLASAIAQALQVVRGGPSSDSRGSRVSFSPLTSSGDGLLGVVEEERAEGLERFGVGDAGDGELLRALKGLDRGFGGRAEIAIDGEIRRGVRAGVQRALQGLDELAGGADLQLLRLIGGRRSFRLRNGRKPRGRFSRSGLRRRFRRSSAGLCCSA